MDKGSAKSTVTMQHQKLADKDTADQNEAVVDGAAGRAGENVGMSAKVGGSVRSTLKDTSPRLSAGGPRV